MAPLAGGERVWKLSMVCLHNNAIVARDILVTILHGGTLEPRLSAIYIVRSVGTSLILDIICTLIHKIAFSIMVMESCLSQEVNKPFLVQI